MKEVLIAAEGIFHNYNQQQVLTDINFSLSKGQIIGLLGVNGAGKTTLMHILCGIIEPSRGSVFIKGVDLWESSVEIKRNIGYLSENNPLYLDLYVNEFLTYAARLYMSHREAKERVEFLIERIGLHSECRKKIQNLSKGNRQKVGLAQALVQNPDILILDEPNNGFDPHQQDEMNRLLVEMSDTKTILLSTHYLQEVSSIANRFLILNGGRIVYDGGEASNIEKIFNDFTR